MMPAGRRRYVDHVVAAERGDEDGAGRSKSSTTTCAANPSTTRSPLDRASP